MHFHVGGAERGALFMAANFMVRKPIPTRRRLPDGRAKQQCEGDTPNIAAKKVGDDGKWDDFNAIVRGNVTRKRDAVVKSSLKIRK